MRFVPIEDKIYEKLEEIAKSKGVKVAELVEEILKKYVEEEKFRKLLDVFCNGRKAVRLKNTPIAVYKGELFLKVKELDEDVLKVIGEHDAKVVEEYDDSGNVVGYAIVPNVGFGESMEDWFSRNGIPLIKKLCKIFLSYND